MNLFERYLSLWVGVCIAVGIVLGQALPGLFQAIGQLEFAQVNLPVGMRCASTFAASASPCSSTGW